MRCVSPAGHRPAVLSGPFPFLPLRLLRFDYSPVTASYGEIRGAGIAPTSGLSGSYMLNMGFMAEPY